MALPRYSLNTLHAFAAAARHLSFTRAAETLCVTQTAVSHQVKLLEAQLGRPLFVRTPRGLQLTDEGALLAPPLQAAFAQIEAALALAEPGRRSEPLTLGVVGTFAHGVLLERLPDFQARHPGIDLRLQLNNNKVDLLAEGLDAAIRFGDGAWERQQAQPLMAAPLAPLCSPALAATLQQPEDLRRCVLLRSYRSEDWPAWAQAAGLRPLPARGPMFDSSVLMVQAAALGAGVALAPPAMFRRELREGRLVQPFPLAVDTGSYWLVRPTGRRPRPALRAFERWLAAVLDAPTGAATITG